MTGLKSILSVYLAPRGFEAQLENELGEKCLPGTRLIFSSEPPCLAVWAQDVWLSPQLIQIKSISDAVRQIKSLARFWTLHSVACHRRAALIQQSLREPKISPLCFPDAMDIPISGVWSLLDESTVLASPQRWKLLPDGIMSFLEDREIPPNRAYLKLWEIFTLMGEHPQPGELCIDLGSSPGGWTWVLQSLGAKVVSVDKAPLDRRISHLPQIRYLKQSAFALEPQDFPKLDWLVCDVACYPDRLYGLIKRWLDVGCVRRMIGTIKLQGKPDPGMLTSFAQIENSKILHLFHNKHELTWIWPVKKFPEMMFI